MNIEIISTVVNSQDAMEVVKEFTDDQGNVTYGLHVIPRNAVINNAAVEGLDDPNDAMDMILYSPHVDVVDDGETIMDRVRKTKERVKPKNPKTQQDRLDKLASAGIPKRYYPIEGMDPIEVIRAHGGVTTENIQEAKDRLNQKEQDNDSQPREQRPTEAGRQRPRRAHISLGTTD